MPADVPAEVRTATSGEAGTSLGRLASVDVLRGLVIGDNYFRVVRLDTRSFAVST